MENTQPVTIRVIRHTDTGTMFCPELQLLYTLQGTIRIQAGREVCDMITGGILLIGSFIHHRIDCTEGSVLQLKITEQMLRLSDPGRASRYRCFCPDDSSGKQGSYDRVRIQLARLFKLYSRDPGQDTVRLVSATTQLLAVLGEHFPEKASPEHQDPTDERYVRIMGYIHENWREPITISQIAQREYLSAGHLSRYFRDHTGVSLTGYLTELRLQNAARLLAEGDVSVTQVALSCGFRSASGFISRFRDRFGMTPKSYRETEKQRRERSGSLQEEWTLEDGIEQLLRYAQLEELSAADAFLPTVHRQVAVEVQKPGTALRQPWRKLLNIAYARDGLLAEVQAQLRTAQREVGFEFLRFHGIFDDDMYIYHEDSRGEPFLDFSRVDLLLDYVLSIGLKPYIELSFMPGALAKQERKLYDRRSLLSSFRDERKWRFLVRGFTEHCVERYGREQVRTWRFTTMGCSLVTVGILTRQEHLEIYRTAYESVKAVDSGISFGGPGAMASALWDSSLIRDFLDDARRYRCVPDFFSIQCYPHRAIEQDKDFLSFSRSQEASPMDLSEDEHYTATVVRECRELLRGSGLDHLKLWVEEWNSTLWQRDLSNDTCYKSCWLAMNVCDPCEGAEALGYWLLTDLIEERAAFGNVFHGGYGLFTYNGIPKSGWRGMQLLSSLGDRLLARGPGWMVTGSREGFQILLTHYCHYDKLYRFRYQRLRDPQLAYSVFVEKGDLEYDLQLTQIPEGRYELCSRSIRPRQGSSFDAWLEMGAPLSLRQSETEHLRNASQPELRVSLETVRDRLRLSCSLEPHEIRVITLRRVDRFR